MLSRDDLARAVRTNDALSEAGGDATPRILFDLGVDPMAAVYVAEQRALRVALLHSGWTPLDLRRLAEEDAGRHVYPSAEQNALIPVYAGVWVDALATGIRACDEAHKP